METTNVNAVIMNGYIHTVNEVKVIDVTFSEKCVPVYRKGELVYENMMRISMRDFHSVIVPQSHNIKLIYAVNQLDTNCPMRDIEFNSIFLGAEIALTFTFVEEGEAYEINGQQLVSERAKVLKSFAISNLTADGEKFCMYPLRVYHEQEIMKEELMKQMKKEGKI